MIRMVAVGAVTGERARWLASHPDVQVVLAAASNASAASEVAVAVSAHLVLRLATASAAVEVPPTVNVPDRFHPVLRPGSS